MDSIKDIRARCKNATAGEWTYSVLNGTKTPMTLYSDYEDDEVDIAEFEKWDSEYYAKEMIGNAEFLIHARQDIPLLCDRVEELEEELKRWEELFIQFDLKPPEKGGK